jgi:hypothetical protein
VNRERTAKTGSNLSIGSAILSHRDLAMPGV